jgi:hypothetical protein
MDHLENPYDSKLMKEPPRAAGNARFSWLTSVICSGTAVYGPYVVMAIYTQIYVSCDHCKQATRNLLVCAPGLLPMELAQRGLGISRQADWIWFGVATLFALAWIAGLAWLFRRSLWLGVPAAVLTFAISSWLAIVLLAMIRM